MPSSLEVRAQAILMRDDSQHITIQQCISDSQDCLILWKIVRLS